MFPKAVDPSVANTVASSRAPSIQQSTAVNHALNGELPGGIGAAKDLVTKPMGPNGDVEAGKTTWEETLGFLKLVEYRYTRFALNPASNQWIMVRDWRDPQWTSIRAVAAGLDTPTREQRRVLTGENMIDIEGKSVFGLLIDEVSCCACPWSTLCNILRSFTPFTSFKSPPSSCGQSMITTTTPSLLLSLVPRVFYRRWSRRSGSVTILQYDTTG